MEHGLLCQKSVKGLYVYLILLNSSKAIIRLSASYCTALKGPGQAPSLGLSRTLCCATNNITENHPEEGDEQARALGKQGRKTGEG